MTTIAIVGAGPGLGAAVARRFGAEGFNIALLARNQGRVDALAAELASSGLTAAATAPTYESRTPSPGLCSAQRTTSAPSRSCNTAPSLSPSSCARCWKPPSATSPVPWNSPSTDRSPPCSKSCPACDLWAGERCCSSTAAAAPGPTQTWRAPPSPSRAKAHTRRCPCPRPRRARRKALDDAHNAEHFPRLRRTNGALSQSPEAGPNWGPMPATGHHGTPGRDQAVLHPRSNATCRGLVGDLGVWSARAGRPTRVDRPWSEALTDLGVTPGLTPI